MNSNDNSSNNVKNESDSSNDNSNDTGNKIKENNKNICIQQSRGHIDIESKYRIDENQAQFDFCMSVANILDETKHAIDSLNQEFTAVKDTQFYQI